jgi:hypothetical protein
MPVEEILKQYGPHGLYAAILWRVLSWVGKRVDELLADHKEAQKRVRRHMARQTLLLKGMVTLLKDQGVIVEEIRNALRGDPRVLSPLNQKNTSAPGAGPVSSSSPPLGFVTPYPA